MINRASVQLWGHSETIGRPAKIGREKKGYPGVIADRIADPAARIRFYLHKDFRAAGIRFYLHKEYGGAMLMKMAVLQ